MNLEETPAELPVDEDITPETLAGPVADLSEAQTSEVALPKAPEVEIIDVPEALPETVAALPEPVVAEAPEVAIPAESVVNSEPAPIGSTLPTIDSNPFLEEARSMAAVVPIKAEALIADVEPAKDTPIGDDEDLSEIGETVIITRARKKAVKTNPGEPKAPRKPARKKEKLPDLGDGSGYIAPDDGDSPAEDVPWFAVHCYSGQENKVKTNLEQRIDTMGMAGKILKIVVPTEDEIEVRDGKRKTVKRQVYPGYVLVQMAMSEESWFVVRNTPGVTRFVGMGNRPQPLSQQEVNVLLGRMEAEAPKIRVNFRAGQKVRITDGPFADFIGVVDKIDTERAKVVALVSFFGRETPVELDFLQVEKT
jgi:transcription termination/antitermination protein NusG